MQYIGRKFRKISNNSVYTLKSQGLQREGKKNVAYDYEESIQQIMSEKFILIPQKNSRKTKQEDKKININQKIYKKSLEIESRDIVFQNYKKLIFDITFFTNLKNDINDENQRQELDNLLQKAHNLLVQEVEIYKALISVNLAIIGNFGSGKSSFINSLIGKKLCPVKINPTTSSITRFIYSDKPKIMLVNEGREISFQEYTDLVQHNNLDNMDKTKSYQIDYYYPFEGMRDIVIYDTPGFNNPKNTQDEKVTIKYATEADVIFLVIDINNGDIDNALLEKIKKIKKNNTATKWYLIVNKADNKAPESRKKILSNLQKKYINEFETIIIYSSKNSDSKIDFDNQLENIYKNVKEQLEKAMTKKVPDINLHINMKKNRNSKIYDCYIDDNYIGKFQAEKDLDKLKKNQKQEVLSILKDIGRNKYNFLSNKYDLEFKLYETEARRVVRHIQNNLFKISDKNEYSIFLQEIDHLLFEIKTKLKKKKFLTLLFKEIIKTAQLIPVDKKEKDYTFSPWWKWKYNYNIRLRNLDYTHSIMQELEDRYGLNKEKSNSLFFNIESFLVDELWNTLEVFLVDNEKYYFYEAMDAHRYKNEIYSILDLNKSMNLEQKLFFEAVDADIENLRDILLTENEEVTEYSEHDEIKQNEINEKINKYLGERNVR